MCCFGGRTTSTNFEPQRSTSNPRNGSQSGWTLAWWIVRQNVQVNSIKANWMVQLSVEPQTPATASNWEAFGGLEIICGECGPRKKDQQEPPPWGNGLKMRGPWGHLGPRVIWVRGLQLCAADSFARPKHPGATSLTSCPGRCFA